MSPSVSPGPGWSLHVEQEWIDVTSERSTPNERWRFTDAAGHEHFYSHGYPSLELVVDASHWCDGSEGFERHDPHEQIDEAHYECLVCREVIEPTSDPPYTPKQIPGTRSATLKGVRSDGAQIEVWLTDDEVRSLRPDSTADDVAALLDSLPDDRTLSLSFSRGFVL